MTQLLVASSSREQLLVQQQQLSKQLKSIQFKLFDKASPDVVEHINQLQLERAKQEGILQQAQMQLEQLKPELENFNNGAEQILLQAISQQVWYAFKNKREIVFDSRVGLLFPNFEYVPHIAYNDWKAEQKEYAPSGVGKKQWVALDSLNEVSAKSDPLLHKLYFTNEYKYTFFPLKYAGSDCICICVCKGYTFYHPYGYYNDFCKKNDHKLNNRDSIGNLRVFPVLKVLDNSNLLPEYPRLTTHEKAKIILDFFIEQDWIPVFEPFLTRGIDKNGNSFSEDEYDFQERVALEQKQCDEYNHIFDAYYNRIQLQKQLVDLERQIAELPEPEPENQFTSDFDFRIELQNYHLTEINGSIWQYSFSAQQWLNYLLNQIDDWENRHQDLIGNALEINQILAKKLPSSLNTDEVEQQLLRERHEILQGRLNFELTSLRVALIALLKQVQDLEQQLKNTTSLTLLAQLEQHARPDFALLAEHSATLCTQTLKRLEWLESAVDFIQAVVRSEKQSTEDYLILLDKYQQDLIQIGLDNSIEPEEVKKWFAEWRSERLQTLQQWLPLVEASLNDVIAQQTALDTLQCIDNYQQQLDQFYLQQRLGIHTTYAFVPNGHRQEKLEKEQKLTELNHKFMQQLEKIIFSCQNTAQRIWLVRFSEVWQQGIVQEITEFLRNEELLDRSDIAQIISEEMRKIEQQNLAACLQDAKSYSQALEQHNKDFSTLMFKMRKALQK